MATAVAHIVGFYDTTAKVKIQFLYILHYNENTDMHTFSDI